MTYSDVTIVDIQIYWDSDGESDSGWAFDTRDATGRTSSGRICGVTFDALDEAILQLAERLNIDLTPEAFVREGPENCSFAAWSNPVRKPPQG